MNIKSESEYNFSADINQLMHLIVNAFYSKKEVFLRELLSNSSDALDKIRYQSLTDNKVLNHENELKIQIIPNKENNTLSIKDTGIGMTKSELIENLGTVAKSGTRTFMEYLKKSNQEKLDLIGQFGVGFYSAFLVANKISVITKHNDEPHYLWESSADGSFKICDLETSDINRGTTIILHLKEDSMEYLEEDKLRELVKTHSQYINFPIELFVEEKFEILNDHKPIWIRKADDVTEEEYQAFYKNVSGDYGEYSRVKHFSVEGNLEFSSLLFLPKNKPFDMLGGGEEKLLNKIKLYVRRVFILDNCKDLLPEYLNFVVGVVDSNDLPLNVSREMVQENAILRVIKKQLVKKTIEMMSELSDNKEDYQTFYDSFSKNLKLGVYEDSGNRDKLAKLLRFTTTTQEFVSLSSYLERMKEGQDKIYYISGDSIDTIKNSPFLEQLKKKGYEVIFMTDAIDEYMMQHIKDFDGKEFVDITKEDLDLGETEEEKKENEELEIKFKPLCDHIKEILGEKVSKVAVSNRIVDTSCILSSSKFGWSANMQRIMKAQALHDDKMSQYMIGQKIFEINPNSNTIKALKIRFEKDVHDKTVKDLVWLLYESSVLNSGFTLEDPINFTKRLNKIINLGLSVDEKEDDELLDASLEELDQDLDDDESNMEQID